MQALQHHYFSVNSFCGKPCRNGGCEIDDNVRQLAQQSVKSGLLSLVAKKGQMVRCKSMALLHDQ
jgi:hypothetical protein